MYKVTGFELTLRNKPHVNVIYQIIPTSKYTLTQRMIIRLHMSNYLMPHQPVFDWASNHASTTH